ncbi:MAG: YjbH domain-containing protein [Deltaproteobacteria bacterium]|nr:MAG: YjbH domain-containing protein [Deltaproteobacteria bacterium]
MRTTAEMRRALVLACLVPVAAQAAPTMLNQIPTTDLVPERQVSLQLQNGNTEVSGRSSLFHQPELVPQSEFGLPWNLEAGLDVAPSDPPHDYRPILNLKWRPLREDYRVPAVALGAMQLGVGFTPSYFLVLSKTLNYQQIQYQKFRAHHRNIKLRGIRLHTGMLRTANAWRALVGTDAEVNDHFVIYADWISGAPNAVAVGGVFVIDRQNSIQASVLRGNVEDRVSGLLVGITHTFDLARPFEW